MILNITVNRRHIIQGTPANSKQCPIALAIKEQCDVQDIQVFASFIYLVKDDIEYRSFVSEDVAKFILDYDAWLEVQPISFSMEFDAISDTSFLAVSD